MRGWWHSIDPAPTPSPEALMVTGVRVIICRTVAKKLARCKCHGLPDCEPRQGSTLCSLCPRWVYPGAALCSQPVSDYANSPSFLRSSPIRLSTALSMVSFDVAKFFTHLLSDILTMLRRTRSAPSKSIRACILSRNIPTLPGASLSSDITNHTRLTRPQNEGHGRQRERETGRVGSPTQPEARCMENSHEGCRRDASDKMPGRSPIWRRPRVAQGLGRGYNFSTRLALPTVPRKLAT